KPEEAEAYLLKFANLMRTVLQNSEHEEISFQKELETLEWYIQLEAGRMKYPLHYSIEVDKDIDLENTFVPPNIIQPFVENSIIHGLYPKNEAGNINIRIHRKNEELHII